MILSPDSCILSPVINPILLDDRWESLLPDWESAIQEALTKAAKVLEKNFSNQEVSVVLTNDAEVQKLNKTYRHQDKPTNVLSFVSDADGELGDIILAYETVVKEAEDAGLLPLHHVTHLIIHGFLHLLGYDHHHEEEAQRMETMEIRILRDLNIANPYEEK